MFRPSFNKGSVLKQNMLESLRDYPYTVLEVEYSTYGDGIIAGFEITPQDGNKFSISPGILKLNEIIYVSSQVLTIDQIDEKHYVYLTIRKQDNPDGEDVVLCVDQQIEPIENGLEFFRYTKNADMFAYKNIGEVFSTPMNRINQSYCRYAVSGGSTLHPHYFRLFAEAVLASSNATVNDAAFAYQCLNGINNIDVVDHYFKGIHSNAEILDEMKTILNRLSRSNVPEEKQSEKVERPKKMVIS